MKSNRLILLLTVTFFLLTFRAAWAVCPICTVAVGAGVGVTRWLGIADAITGLWIGGLIVSMIAWTDAFLEARNIRFLGRPWVIAFVYFALTLVPLNLAGIIGGSMNAFHVLPLDKLLWGIIAGSTGFWCGASWYFHLKEKHGGHAYFPFQKVVMPISPLIFLSVLFHLLG